MLDLTQYAGVLVYFLIGAVFVVALFFLSSLFRDRSKNPERASIYECGMEPIGTPYVSPNIRFYIFALLFVIIEIETVFIIPWAVQFKNLGIIGFVEMLLFLGILFVAFVYAWRKGALKWE